MTHVCPHCRLQVWRDQYKIQEYTNLEVLLQRLRCKDLEQLNDWIEDRTDGLVMLFDVADDLSVDIAVTNGQRGAGFTFPMTNMDFLTEIEFLEDHASEFWRTGDESLRSTVQRGPRPLDPDKTGNSRVSMSFG